MRTRRFSVALAALSIPLLAGSAFAVANSVSTTPGPQVIIPSRTSAHTAKTAHHANRVPANATVNVNATSTTVDDHGNDGPGHDANDDRGHDATTSTTVTTTPGANGNDGPGHDLGDDHGDDGTVTTTATTTPDDHGNDGSGDDSGHGSDSSGSGSGN